MRATTNENSTTEAPITTIRSVSRSRIASISSIVGAVSDAPASSASRKGVSLASVSGEGSSNSRIEGCSAAAPQSR